MPEYHELSPILGGRNSGQAYRATIGRLLTSLSPELWNAGYGGTRHIDASKQGLFVATGEDNGGSWLMVDLYGEALTGTPFRYAETGIQTSEDTVWVARAHEDLAPSSPDESDFLLRRMLALAVDLRDMQPHGQQR